MHSAISAALSVRSFVGWIKDVTGAFAGGLYGLAGFMILSGLIVLILGHDTRLEKAPVPVHEAP